MIKRKIEIFTEGCSKCDDTIALVNELVCKSCEVKVWDVKEGCDSNECRSKAKDYGIQSYPAVVINGKLLDCCKNGSGPTKESLVKAGVGSSI